MQLGDGREADDFDALLVHLRYPARHRHRWRSTNLLERSLGEVKRRTEVIGRFPGETPDPSAARRSITPTPSIVYLARTPSDAARYEIERWQTLDDGRTWRRTRITRSLVDDLRPVSPRGLARYEQVIWVSGQRTHWTAFATSIRPPS
jgi:hypothetical protein